MKIGSRFYTVDACSGFGPSHADWTDEHTAGIDDYAGLCKVLEWRVTRIALPRRSRLAKVFDTPSLAYEKAVHVTSCKGDKDSWQVGFRPDRFRPSVKGAYQAMLKSAKQWDPGAVRLIKSSRTRYFNSRT